MKVNTVHSKDEQGRQVTERIVEQGVVQYQFRVTESGHEYQGDGDPPEAAVQALAEFDDRHDPDDPDEDGGDEETEEPATDANQGDGQ